MSDGCGGRRGRQAYASAARARERREGGAGAVPAVLGESRVFEFGVSAATGASTGSAAMGYECE
jgi:hypothetical protein